MTPADRAGLGGAVQRARPRGLLDRKPPGQPSRLTHAHRAALMARLDEGPIPSVHGVVRWRLVDLIQWLWEEFRVPISKQTLEP